MPAKKILETILSVTKPLRLSYGLTIIALILLSGLVIPQVPLWHIQLVSVSPLGAQGNWESLLPSISADGRFIAFYSTSSNLVANDSNEYSDVFVRDMESGLTELISRNSQGEPGNDSSSYAAISGDGRFVAFLSSANNLVPGDNNGADDLFVRDRQLGITEHIGQGYVPKISEDGRFVTFRRFVDPNWTAWLKDRQTSTVEQVFATENEANRGFDMSGDARFIVFGSRSSNLVVGDTNGVSDVFVKDLSTGVIERISVNALGNEANGHSDFPSISLDGRLVAFRSEADNLVPGDSNGQGDTFVYDRQTSMTRRISVDSFGNQSVQGGGEPKISSSGEIVTFPSNSDDLVPGDNNGQQDIFVHYLATGITELVSKTSLGTETNGASVNPVISADGRFVALLSANCG